MAERLKAAVLKTVVGKLTVGSNPTSSAFKLAEDNSSAGNGSIAQLVEHRAFNPLVAGSNPAGLTNM